MISVFAYALFSWYVSSRFREFFDAVVKAWTFTAISGTLAVTVVALVSIPHWSACCHVFIMLSVLYIDLMGTYISHTSISSGIQY